MLVKLYSGAVNGIEAATVTLEVNILSGARFVIVGLPDNAVRESQQRVDSALREIGFRIPGRRVIVNLSPADIKKEGTGFDLPLAIGIMTANGDISPPGLEEYLFLGELSLDGSLVPVKGVLPIVIQARREGFSRIVLPLSNANEAAAVEGMKVYGFRHLREVTGFLLSPEQPPYRYHAPTTVQQGLPDFSDVKGQAHVKRAFEIAAAGMHNLILVGPPGSGKTMLARRLPGILPPMTTEESLETTKIHSVAGKLSRNASLITERPFRSPHHTVSNAALAGGGNPPRPGEISLATNGVLFLDELPEFQRTALEVLRQPLEDREITISRARYSVCYPADFMLVAAMNPCPCGYYNHPSRSCTCTEHQIRQYLSRISGPLLDRISLQLEVVPVGLEHMEGGTAEESSSTIRSRVMAARLLQTDRLKDYPGIHCNAQLPAPLVRRFCRPSAQGLALLKAAISRFGLSARAYDHILRVARTIADLAGSPEPETAHVAEAIQFRTLDRENWGR